MYADYDFYKSTYGGTAFTTEASYAKYAEMAADFMDFATRLRITDNLPSSASSLKAIKRCECVIADLYKQIDDIKTNGTGIVSGGIVKSMSSGGESISIEPGSLQTAIAGGEVEIRKYLADEAKIYLAGITDDEGHYYYYWGI